MEVYLYCGCTHQKAFRCSWHLKEMGYPWKQGWKLCEDFTLQIEKVLAGIGSIRDVDNLVKDPLFLFGDK